MTTPRPDSAPRQGRSMTEAQIEEYEVFLGAYHRVGRAAVTLRWSSPSDRAIAESVLRSAVEFFEATTGRAPTPVQFLGAEVFALGMSSNGGGADFPGLSSGDALACALRVTGFGGKRLNPDLDIDAALGLFPVDGPKDREQVAQHLRAAVVGLWRAASSRLPVAEVLAARIALQIVASLDEHRGMPEGGATPGVAPHGVAWGSPSRDETEGGGGGEGGSNLYSSRGVDRRTCRTHSPAPPVQPESPPAAEGGPDAE